jgi:hypothetical protein
MLCQPVYVPVNQLWGGRHWQFHFWSWRGPCLLAIRTGLLWSFPPPVWTMINHSGNNTQHGHEMEQFCGTKSKETNHKLQSIISLWRLIGHTWFLQWRLWQCGLLGKHTRVSVSKVCGSLFIYSIFLAVLGFELRASHLLGRCSITWATSLSPFCFNHFLVKSGVLLSFWLGRF